ncbi:hypothetical protein E2C06_13190 [Dankookia rubra]|uniref:Uncharacterized protein n=1 Tax=Dankookia rubra TaxID=1442381 RepID=A0A4R5QHU0_9PROT|nr:hypothetical protein [Dankookia rubra]TDH62127.1 hypothetical protein E2C06_13190 [Dankookia rubra]
MLVDVRPRHALAWDASLEPIGESGVDKEPFETWWARVRHRLANLHPLVAEQWVYKYWRHSPFCHLPLERLSCRLERWSTERILQEVAWGWPDSDQHPEFNYEVFHGKGFEPGRTMDATGTWNIPPVILEAPGGLLTNMGERPEAHYWLIEGHQRRRYLHALAWRDEGGGRPGAMHEVFLLSLSDVPL